jgi:hypothetical protein
MADMTRAEMIDFVLEHLGVKAASQTARAEDQITAGKAIDSLHSRLQKKGLASFLISAFPDWAQMPFAQCVAVELATPFKLPMESRQQFEADAPRGLKELAEQAQGKKPRAQTKVLFF